MWLLYGWRKWHSRNKTHYQYYKCTSAKKKTGCDKKAVRKNYIEDIVVKIALELLYDGDLIDKICDKLIEFQNKENSNIPRIKKQISDITKAANNILAVIEQGVASTTLTERLIKLEKEKTELKIALAQEEIATPLFTKDQLLFWFDNLKKIDVSTFKGKQKVIDVFINSIYLYDDKIVVTFNHENEQRSISLAEIENSDLGANAPP
ncbi:MAG: zinc ribbon domain-containing protein [Clostridia bacterium]